MLSLHDTCYWPKLASTPLSPHSLSHTHTHTLTSTWYSPTTYSQFFSLNSKSISLRRFCSALGSCRNRSLRTTFTATSPVSYKHITTAERQPFTGKGHTLCCSSLCIHLHTNPSPVCLSDSTRIRRNGRRLHRSCVVTSYC